MSQPNRPVIITAAPIAFRENGELHVDGTRQILQKVARSGVDGVLILGTTGEFPSLSFEEREEITCLAVAECSRMRCIVHVGAASLFQTRRLINQARSCGATEIALLTPYYLPVTDGELVRFYTSAAEAAGDLDIYVYVFRDRTGNAVSSQVMGKLAQIPNIVGAKVSGEPGERLLEYRGVVPPSFTIYTGADRDLGLVQDFGAQGIVSGNAAALPRPFTNLATAMSDAASVVTMADAQAAVDDVSDVIQGDMARIKAALRMQGIDAGYPRMPIEEPDEEALREIRRVVEHYGSASSEYSGGDDT